MTKPLYLFRRRASIAAAQAIAIVFLIAAFAASIPGLVSARPGESNAPSVIEPDGTLDPAFNAGNFTNGSVHVTALQADGKLLIGGQFAKVHGVKRRSIARLNADGTLDLSFDPGDLTENGARHILLQADGKIIILDLFNRVFRLNADGSLDNSFDLDRRVSNDGADDGNGRATNPGSIVTAVLQADGKLVVGGAFSYVITGPGTSVARSCVARFNSDGTFDASYDPGAGALNSAEPFLTLVNHTVRQNLLLNNGKVIIQGDFDSFDGQAAPGLARLNPDGSFDTTFTPGSGAPDPFSVFGLFVQSDDQVIVFGTLTSFSGTPCNSMVRLTTLGIVDPTFGPGAFQEYGRLGQIAAVAQQTDTKLIVTGYFHSAGGTSANNVVRLETTGARDATFDATGAGPSGYHISAALVRPSDGKIFLGGYFSSYGGAQSNNIAWANSDGSADNIFAGLAGVTDFDPDIFALATQSDGKIIAGGFFSSFNGTSHYNLVRLNADGTSDASFNANVDTERSVRAVLVQADGKILIAGNFVAVNGVACGGIARLNSDGTLDLSFNPGTGANGGIQALAHDPADGSIYLG